MRCREHKDLAIRSQVTESVLPPAVLELAHTSLRCCQASDVESSSPETLLTEVSPPAGPAHWFSYSLTSSTRRFRARPSNVSFDSFGRVEPYPTVVSRSAETWYCSTSAFFT